MEHKFLINLREAGKLLGVSRVWIYRKAKSDATFPKLIRIGGRATRIELTKLQEWVKSQSE